MAGNVIRWRISLSLCFLGGLFFTLDKETLTTSWQSSWIPVCLMVPPQPDLQTDHLFQSQFACFPADSFSFSQCVSLKTASYSHPHYTLIASRRQQQQQHNKNSMKSKFKSITAAQPLFLIKPRNKSRQVADKSQNVGWMQWIICFQSHWSQRLSMLGRENNDWSPCRFQQHPDQEQEEEREVLMEKKNNDIK